MSVVTSTLESMGASGAAITVLMTTVSALAAVVVYQNKRAEKINGHRLTERDTLNKALTEASAALLRISDVTKERNNLTNELAEAIQAQSIAFERLRDKIEFQYVSLKEETQRQSMIVSAVAESSRTTAAQLMDVRNVINSLTVQVQALITQRGARR